MGECSILKIYKIRYETKSLLTIIYRIKIYEKQKNVRYMVREMF